MPTKVLKIDTHFSKQWEKSTKYKYKYESLMPMGVLKVFQFNNGLPLLVNVLIDVVFIQLFIYKM